MRNRDWSGGRSSEGDGELARELSGDGRYVRNCDLGGGGSSRGEGGLMRALSGEEGGLDGGEESGLKPPDSVYNAMLRGMDEG